MPSYAFNRSGSPPDDHRSRLGGPCNIPIILLTLCECAPERLPCLVESLKATQLFLRPYPRFTSYLYQVYETIPPMVTSWYTIWAQVIVIVATYRRVVTPIVSTALSWVYPSFSSSPHGRIRWNPAATSPFWLVSTTTWLVCITTPSLFGLRPRSITACLWEDGIALSPSSF